MTSVLRKDQLEKSLFEEKNLIKTGKIQEDNPLDDSPAFTRLCNACRRGDLKVCQEAIQEGVNINASDEYNYTPLILASLCGHYEVVHLLLESGALCERDTFQGERCLYNALNDRIRNLLLAYDYSKSTDPLQPFASHLYSLLGRTDPSTADITIVAGDRLFALHKFILAARSPFFRRKLQEKPDTVSWNLPANISVPSFEVAIKYIYLGEIPRDLGIGSGSAFTEEDVLAGIDRLSRLLEIQNLMQRILEGDDRRVQRQQRQAEVARGRTQIDTWFKENVLGSKFEVEPAVVTNIKWTRVNPLFADVILHADDDADETTFLQSGRSSPSSERQSDILGEGTSAPDETSLLQNATSDARKATLFPVHRAMLLRSEYFLNMFTSGFLESQDSEHLRVIPVACSAPVLEKILGFLYAERTDFELQLAIDVLFAADMLLIERLKAKAAVIISSLGNGVMTTQHPAATPHTDPFLPEGEDEQAGGGESHNEEDPLDPYATLRAAWDLRVPRLETFAARYFAYRLERYIDTPEFVEAIRESAARIKGRQETDSIELVDDIRFYLSERFRLRFEGDGIEELLNEDSAGRKATEDDIEITNISEQFQKTGLEIKSEEDVNIEHAGLQEPMQRFAEGQVIRTLDGLDVGDEFAADALNYESLMGKIDMILENLNLDA